MKNLPIGTQTFSKIREENKLYVDKTKYIYNLTHSYDYVFLSRPRRFGKSLLCDTFKMYFEGRKDLFEGLAIMDLEKDWKTYPVIHLDLSIREDNIENIKYSIKKIFEEYENLYSVKSSPEEPLSVRLSSIVKAAYQQTGQRVAIIIDEYDATLLNNVDNQELFQKVRSLFNSLFSPIKSLDPYIKFLFITGISKFSQMSIFSALNNLVDISLDARYEGICGFTKDEIHSDFEEYVVSMAENFDWNLETAYNELKNNYDGYHFSSKMTCDVFNPFSILNALEKKTLQSFWFDSASPSALIKLVDKFDLDYKELENIRVDLESFSVPIESIDDPLPLLFQSGYLTIKDYDREVDSYTLSFPNKEVRVAFAKQLLKYKTQNCKCKIEKKN